MMVMVVMGSRIIVELARKQGLFISLDVDYITPSTTTATVFIVIVVDGGGRDSIQRWRRSLFGRVIVICWSLEEGIEEL